MENLFSNFNTIHCLYIPLGFFFITCLQVAELSQELDTESEKSMQLEAQNRDLREELSTLHGNCEKQKSKCQLKEGVAKLQHHLQTNMVDHNQKQLLGNY